MRHGRLRIFTVAAALAAIAIVTGRAQDNAADVRELVEALQIHGGSTVADIGAGDAALTIPMASVVGPSGRVFATELPGRPVEELRAIVRKSGVDNVAVVEGDPLKTNLAPSCCEAVFVRFVYHHFADPPAMNASLRDALRPGGRLAVIDFAPNGPEAATPAGRAGGKTHGVTSATVARELADAGFEFVSSRERGDRTFIVVVRKPATAPGGRIRPARP